MLISFGFCVPRTQDSSFCLPPSDRGTWSSASRKKSTPETKYFIILSTCHLVSFSFSFFCNPRYQRPFESDSSLLVSPPSFVTTLSPRDDFFPLFLLFWTPLRTFANRIPGPDPFPIFFVQLPLSPLQSPLLSERLLSFPLSCLFLAVSGH